MELIYSLFIGLLLVSALAYLMVMLVLSIGWYSLSNFQYKHQSQAPLFVSIVVAVRNESKNILALLNSLIAQSHPADHFEIILIDDHSEDNTRQLIEVFSRGSTHNISLVEAQGEGKKQALRQGIQVAKGEWIVATDGDCSMGPQWLAHLVNYIQLNQVKLLIGPVVYFQEKSFISKLFSLDFMSLVASGAAAVGAGFPFMGNGANIAFSKDAYLEVKDRLGDETYASGDDVFLIHGVVSAYGRKSVHFIKNPQSIVSTAAPASISAFFQQRLRWGSKAKGYKLPWAMGLSMVVFLYSLMLTSLLCASIVFPWVGLVYVLFCLLKFLADVVLLHAFSEFASRRKLMKYVLPFELIYPIYIVITAFSGLFFSYTWKGRAGRT